MAGPVIIAYIVLAIILPESDDGSQAVPIGKAGTIGFAAFLIAVGVFILIDSLIPYRMSQFFLPLCLIGAGVGVIYWAAKKK